jgi:hypothetical protein
LQSSSFGFLHFVSQLKPVADSGAHFFHASSTASPGQDFLPSQDFQPDGGCGGVLSFSAVLAAARTH